MPIYRGPGGSGDATADSASEALLIRELAIEVQADADAAATSATAAAGSASSASTSATSASNSASNAATSATNASNSASAAATSASNAATSATAAQTAETAAELAETNAETAETNAANSASAAASSASNASTSATNASNSASAAATSATNASNSASAASTSATNAANSAASAATSASTATTQASNASTSATNAASSATSAAGSATTATTQAGIATTQATNAASSASAAATSATTATTQAGIATTQATNASNSATAAATSATNASNSATSAATSATNAANSATAAAASAASINLSSIAITGGTINGTTIGASTPSTGSFTSLTDSGNLTFTGTGNRIRGDFSNGTVANRVAFQSSTTNGLTTLSVVPNGTGTQGIIDLYNNSDPTNASTLQLIGGLTQSSIRSTITGTGTYVPITMFTGGSERLRIDTSGNVGIGTSSPSYNLDILTGAGGGVKISDGTTSIETFNSGGVGYTGTGTNHPFGITTNGTERMRIDSSGNVGIGQTSPSCRLDVNRGSAGLLANFTDGVNTNFQIETASLLATIGPSAGSTGMAFKTGNTERMRITSGGALLVGATSSISGSVSGVEVNGAGLINIGRNTTSAASQIVFYNPNGFVGQILTSGTSTTYSTTSDYRLKEAVSPMTGALAKVSALKPVTYTWKTDGSSGQGFIAHELQAVVPDCVTGEKDAVDAEGKPVYQGIDTSFLVATLTAAIQEQQALIEQLTTRLNALEGN